MLRLRNMFVAPLLMVASMILTACGGHDEPKPEPVKEPTRTVLVYMVANNNLGTRGYDRMDLDEMQAAAAAGKIPADCHLVVYHAARNKTPMLKEVTPDGLVELKRYDGGYLDGLSLTPERVRDVLADVEALAPADSYGLVLWSHGTGWVETADSRSAAEDDADGGVITLSPGVSTQSFGDDHGYEMNVTSLAKALEGRSFDFVYFDACLMGSVEVAYELRHAAPFIVGSPTELQVYGMRYDLNIPEFFKPAADVVAAARNTYEYYASEPVYNGQQIVAACSMVVIDTRELPALAAATRDIMATGALPAEGHTPVSYYRQFDDAMVDMVDYIASLEGVDPALAARWRAAYDKALVYSAATATYGRYDLSAFAGMACAYIDSPLASTLHGYRNQAWWADVVSHNPSLNAPAE